MSSSADNTVAVWDVRMLNPKKCKALGVGTHRLTCQSAYFAPDGSKRVLSTSRDDTLRVWDASKAMSQVRNFEVGNILSELVLGIPVGF